KNFSWPGNVRELRNCLERAAALSATDMIEARQLMLGDVGQGSGVSEKEQPQSSLAQSPPVTLDELERQHIMHVLSETGGNRERTAAILGISARTLYRKLREYETATDANAFAAEDCQLVSPP